MFRLATSNHIRRHLQPAQNVSTTSNASVSQTSTQTQTQSQAPYVSITGCPSASYSPTVIQTPQAQPSTFSASWTQSPTLIQSESQSQSQSQSPTTLTPTSTATSTKSVSPPQQGATSIFTQYYTEIIVSSSVLGSLITFAIISNIWDCIKRKQKKAQDKKKALTEVVPNPTYNQNIRHSSVGNLIRSF